ncbi:hypothetical protein [Pseudomonas sp. A-B-26]
MASSINRGGGLSAGDDQRVAAFRVLVNQRTT